MHKFFANTLFIGKKTVFLPTCHSTNDIAASLVPQNDIYEGTVIVTENQTSGKGQRGNDWEAGPKMNLTFSVILRPVFLQISDQFYLNIIISLAIYDLLEKHLPHGLKIKWPNDIYYNDNKLGGILIENTIKNNKIESTIAGIGLNVNQTKFRYVDAISLSMILGKRLNLENLLNDLLVKIEKRYLQLKSGARGQLQEGYLHRLYWLNEDHIFKGQGFFNGVIKGIGNTGKLAIEVDGEVKYFDLKEVKFIK